MPSKTQFRRRILLADGDPECLQSCSDALGKQGYEVITTSDGFEALCVLRGATPDLLVTELNLPLLSGFELLSVVRKRFPEIGAIAISGDYTPASMPSETICDGFVAKGRTFNLELLEKLRALVKMLPLRASRVNADAVPVWIPRSRAGYIVLTCPECLRTFSAREPRESPSCERCVFCDAKVPFQMSGLEQVRQPPLESLQSRAREVRKQAREAVKRSRSAPKR